MPLAESYTFKPKSIPAYFDAILDARPPERFSIKFLENLGFMSTNDRLFVGILKDLGFLNRDGVPQQRYFDFLDRPQSKLVLAEGIREAFSDLFAVNTKAQEYTVDQARNKLRTLFAGKKTDLVIGHIAKTFKALCDYADFSKSRTAVPKPAADKEEKLQEETPPTETPPPSKSLHARKEIDISALQYHLNIVLPETRDQAVYDAIFRSLRDHLG